MVKYRRIIARLAVLSLVFLVAPYAFSRIASSWRRVSIHADDNAPAVAPNGQSLRVACYNIAHGRGQSVDNWTGESLETRKRRLDDLADLIRSTNADIVILNEVDFDSSWSRSMNQAQYLAQKVGYSYRAEQRNLDFRVLIWTWRFGNAVLSRWPISEAHVLDFPGFSTLETVLAGKKRGLECAVDFNGNKVTINAVHLSHRSEGLRTQSTNLLTAGVLAGDFNSTPSGFPGSVSDSIHGNAMDQLHARSEFHRTPLETPTSDDQLTFHAARPQSVIDWILVSKDWRVLDYKVVPSLLSDHRMIVTEIQSAATP